MSKLWQIMKSNKVRNAGVAMLFLFVLCAILAPWIAPHDPWEFGPAFLHPSTTHLLGTNDVGQDIFSELLYGARNSLLVGFAAALCPCPWEPWSDWWPGSARESSMTC